MPVRRWQLFRSSSWLAFDLSLEIMKKFPLAMFGIITLAAASCSRSDKAETSVTPTPNPNAEQLKADSERLQQATNNAAKEREKAAHATTTPSSTP